MLRRTHKGQMEILGLAIVIVIIVFGFMLYLNFSSSKKSSNVHQSYAIAQLAVGTANTLLDTVAYDSTTGSVCNKTSFRTLLADCANDDSLKCITSGDSFCAFAKDQISDILEDSLGANGLGLEYYFVLVTDFRKVENTIRRFGSPQESFEIGTKCTQKISSQPIPIQTPNFDTVYVILDICR